MINIANKQMTYIRQVDCQLCATFNHRLQILIQGVKVGSLGRQNERNSSYFRLAPTSIFGLCFMSVCLIKSNCYSLMYSSLGQCLYSCTFFIDGFPKIVLLTINTNSLYISHHHFVLKTYTDV